MTWFVPAEEHVHLPPDLVDVLPAGPPAAAAASALLVLAAAAALAAHLKQTFFWML